MYYDETYDWNLIVSSFAKQYGIRLLSNDSEILYPEYYRLLAGLTDDTPLGHIVSIRSEKDPKTIKTYGNNEKRIRREWQKFRSKQINKVLTDEEKKQRVSAFQQAMKQAFGTKKAGDIK